MKKFFCVVAILALVFALACPAFAAGPAVKSVIAPIGSNVTVGDLLSDVSCPDAGDRPQEVYEITLGDGTDHATKAVVSFVWDKAGDIEAVYVQNEDGSWTQCKWSMEEGGSFFVEFPHLSPVSFVLKAETVVEPGKDDTKKPEAAKPGAAAPAAPKSPKTGYNTALWAVSAAAMAMAAGVCFSRRKVAE